MASGSLQDIKNADVETLELMLRDAHSNCLISRVESAVSKSKPSQQLASRRLIARIATELRNRELKR